MIFVSPVTWNAVFNADDSKASKFTAEPGTRRVSPLAAGTQPRVLMTIDVQRQTERVATVPLGDELKIG